MSILVGRDTRVVVQGLTGEQGRFHGLRNRAYGTNVVAGTTPGKGGQDVDGIPVFDTVMEAVHETQANTALIFVPARFAAESIYEAAEATVPLIVCITEGIPVHDMAPVAAYLRSTESILIGPNCPGLISPGLSNVGIIPGEICTPGRVGVVSRSGTLTYQIVHELTTRGLGQSTCIGIGGDPVHGLGFIDALERFDADPDTDLVVLIGEIGGGDEEEGPAPIAGGKSTPGGGDVARVSPPPPQPVGPARAPRPGSRGAAPAQAGTLAE